MARYRPRLINCGTFLDVVEQVEPAECGFCSVKVPTKRHGCGERVIPEHPLDDVTAGLLNTLVPFDDFSHHVEHSPVRSGRNHFRVDAFDGVAPVAEQLVVGHVFGFPNA